MPGAYPLQALIRQLNAVKTDGQAAAAARAALAAAAKGRVVAGNELPSGLAGAFAGTASATKTIAGLDNSVERLRANLKLIEGGPPSRGVGPAWLGVRRQISTVYETLFDVYDRANRPPAFLDGLVADFGRDIERYSDKNLKGKGLLERAGTIIGDVGREAGKGVGAAGAGIGAGASGALSQIFKAIWKPLLAAVVVAGVVGVVYVTVQAKALRV